MNFYGRLLTQHLLAIGQYVRHLYHQYPALRLFLSLIAGYTFTIYLPWGISLIGIAGLLTLFLGLSLLHSPSPQLPRRSSAQASIHPHPRWAWGQSIGRYSYRIGSLCLLAAVLGYWHTLGGSLVLPSITEVGQYWQSHCLRIIDQANLNPEVRTLLSAITLGYLPYSQEGKALRTLFVQGGVAHILAVSGFHIGIVALLLRQLIYLFPSALIRIASLRMLWVLGGVWSFTLLTGCALPSVRAALMLTLYLGGNLVGRPAMPLNIWCITAFLQLLCLPSSIHSKGFWLSYVAVLSILVYYPYLRQLFSDTSFLSLRWLSEAIGITIAVQIGLLPLQIYFFSGISWGFIWLTIPTLILCPLLILLGLVLLSSGIMGLHLPYLDWAINQIGMGLLQLTELAGTTPYMQSYLRISTIELVVWYLPIVLLGLWWHSRKHRLNLFSQGASQD